MQIFMFMDSTMFKKIVWESLHRAKVWSGVPFSPCTISRLHPFDNGLRAHHYPWTTSSPSVEWSLHIRQLLELCIFFFVCRWHIVGEKHYAGLFQTESKLVNGCLCIVWFYLMLTNLSENIDSIRDISRNFLKLSILYWCSCVKESIHIHTRYITEYLNLNIRFT